MTLADDSIHKSTCWDSTHEHCVNWCDLFSSWKHQTMPEGADLAVEQGHISPPPVACLRVLKP